MKLTLPAPPSVNAMYRNVAGRGRVKTTAYKTWISEARWAARPQRLVMFMEPAVVSIAVPENGRRDIDGFIKPILDMLVVLGVLEDDRCKYVRGISIVWHDEPLVHVTVEASV